MHFALVPLTSYNDKIRRFCTYNHNKDTSIDVSFHFQYTKFKE